MYVSAGTAMFFAPMLSRVSRWVYAAETTRFPGSLCCSSMEYSFEYGRFRSLLYRFVVPRLKPVDGPSSFNCGIPSPFRSRHGRVSFVTRMGLIPERRAVPTPTLYRLADTFNAVLPLPNRS